PLPATGPPDPRQRQNRNARRSQREESPGPHSQQQCFERCPQRFAKRCLGAKELIDVSLAGVGSDHEPQVAEEPYEDPQDSDQKEGPAPSQATVERFWVAR